MVGAIAIDLTHQVMGVFAEADTVQVSALLDESIAQGIATFRFPLRPFAEWGMVSPEEVVAVREQMQKGIGFLDGAEGWGGGGGHQHRLRRMKMSGGERQTPPGLMMRCKTLILDV